MKETLISVHPSMQCHASTIVETSKKTILSAWFAGSKEGAPNCSIYLSRLDGHKWTTPKQVANGIQYVNTTTDTIIRRACWNPVLHQIKNGPLQLYYKVGKHPKLWWGMLTESHDDGHKWEHPQRLPEGILGPIRCKPVTDDDTIICGSSTEDTNWQVHLEITSNNGNRWFRTEPIPDKNKLQAIQPTILKHNDKYYILCRTKKRIIAISESTNLINWSNLEPTGLPNPNSGIDAITLKNKVHLLIYNNSDNPMRGRTVMNLAISYNMAEWLIIKELENGREEYSYPAIIQADDGTIHITYTYGRRAIKHISLQPEELEY